MKHILTFPLFESVSLTPDQENFLDKAIEENNLSVKWVQDPKTGKVTTLGEFNGYKIYHAKGASPLEKQKTRETFSSISFGVSEGDFVVNDMQIQSLSNFPSVVEGDLSLDGNFLLTLEGLPKKIYKRLSVERNRLITLEGLEESEVQGLQYFGGNWVRPYWMREDLQKVKSIGTWVPIYLDILSGETAFTEWVSPTEKKEAMAFIMEKKTSKAQMEEAIRVAPAEMAWSLTRKKHMPQEMQDLLPTLDVPEGFWDAPDMVSDLEDVGL
jgi:hypothetical protein